MNKTFTFVDDKVAIGSKHSAKSLSRIKDNTCTAILNVAIDLDISYSNHERHKSFDLEYHKVGLNDSEDNNLEMLNAAVQVLKQLLDRKHTVLLHCAAGASRSVIIYCLYLVKYKQINFDDALKYVKSKRPQASPKSGIVKLAKQLIETWN